MSTPTASGFHAPKDVADAFTRADGVFVDVKIKLQAVVDAGAELKTTMETKGGT